MLYCDKVWSCLIKFLRLNTIKKKLTKVYCYKLCLQLAAIESMCWNVTHTSDLFTVLSKMSLYNSSYSYWGEIEQIKYKDKDTDTDKKQQEWGKTPEVWERAPWCFLTASLYSSWPPLFSSQFHRQSLHLCLLQDQRISSSSLWILARSIRTL